MQARRPEISFIRIFLADLRYNKINIENEKLVVLCLFCDLFQKKSLEY
jgi:hypothetical protein